MSKKVSHRSSITNQSTCGGPIKAGLAPRSTNFMMGVKRNHHFHGQPFRDNKESSDYACIKDNISSAIKYLERLQYTPETINLIIKKYKEKTLDIVHFEERAHFIIFNYHVQGKLGTPNSIGCSCVNPFSSDFDPFSKKCTYCSVFFIPVAAIVAVGGGAAVWVLVESVLSDFLVASELDAMFAVIAEGDAAIISEQLAIQSVAEGESLFNALCTVFGL